MKESSHSIQDDNQDKGRWLHYLIVASIAFTCAFAGSAFYQHRLDLVDKPAIKIKVIDVAALIKDEINVVNGDPQTLQKRATEVMLLLKQRTDRLIAEGYIVLDDSVVVDAPQEMKIKLHEGSYD